LEYSVLVVNNSVPWLSETKGVRQCANLVVPLIVLMLQDNGDGVLTPLSSADLSDFAHLEPPDPSLPQMVVLLGWGHLSSIVITQSFHIVRWTSLKSLSVRTPLLISSHKTI
jgi:hypothetical protein